MLSTALLLTVAGQVKLYFREPSAPTSPKLGVAPVSFNVYQKVFTFPKSSHPTWSQKTFALATSATATFSVGPDTGHPVSVIQTGFPPATAEVWLKPVKKRPWPLATEFGSVSSQKGYASIPKKSQAAITAAFELLIHALVVSICPTRAPDRLVFAMTARTWEM